MFFDFDAALHVGNAMVHLLHTVPILDRTITSVFRILDKSHYVPLSSCPFVTVELHLTNDHEKTILFTNGTLVVALHFRKGNHFKIE